MKSLLKKSRDIFLSPILRDLSRIENSIDTMTNSLDASNQLTNINNLSKFNFWLDMHERQEDGFVMLSPNRDFQLDEAQYEGHFYKDNNLSFATGENFLNLLESRNIDCSLPMWEIGCGPGGLSLGILYNHDFPNFIMSDMSVAFLKIVRDKIKIIERGGRRLSRNYCLAVYDSDNQYNMPPRESFSVIAMQSALHHFTNPEKFILDTSKLVVPGGALIFNEPCREGHALLALLCKFYINFYVSNEGVDNIYEHDYTRYAKDVVDAVTFYCRQDVDKSIYEDKHLFVAEHLMRIARDADMVFDFIQNKGYWNFDPTSARESAYDSLREFSRWYLSVCMGFNNQNSSVQQKEFVEDFCRISEPFFACYDELAAGTLPPTFNGVFILKKKR